jgi:hypothetical protein
MLMLLLLQQHRVDVVQGGARPILRDAYWPQRLSALTARCWGSDIDRRPSFSAVVRELREIVAELDAEGESLRAEAAR